MAIVPATTATTSQISPEDETDALAFHEPDDDQPEHPHDSDDPCEQRGKERDDRTRAGNRPRALGAQVRMNSCFSFGRVRP